MKMTKKAKDDVKITKVTTVSSKLLLPLFVRNNNNDNSGGQRWTKKYIFLCKYSMYQLHDSCSGSVNQDLNLNHNNMYTWDIHQHLSNVQLYVWDEDEGWRRKK